MNKEKITLWDVYKLVNDLREEFNLKIDSLRMDIKSMYTLKAEFEPVKNVVYGLVSIILTSVVGTIVYLVIQK